MNTKNAADTHREVTRGLRRSLVGLGLGALLPVAAAVAQNAPAVYEGNAGGVRLIEQGQPAVMIHSTVDTERLARAASKAMGVEPATTSINLFYNGGTGGVGVQTAPKVYLVFYGSQWTNNDPSGEAAILQGFLKGVGGSAWLNTVTQYCEGVASGTYYCNGVGTPAGNPAGILAGFWYDNAAAAPKHPTQSRLAAEAKKAAKHFGNNSAASNENTQYVIATATKNSASGFGVSYCAWHSSVSSTTAGEISYTNLPYITDAGASCGADFNGLSATAGITIVEGHEMAESITDPYPSTGWVDSTGFEIGDKCAWISTGSQGAVQNITLATGSFAVQSLWSNAFGSGAGGCAISYP